MNGSSGLNVGGSDASRGSFFVIASKTADGLIYDRLERAVDWATSHDRNGTEVFIGMNPRAHEGKSKDAVEYVTACYVDLDLPEGVDQAAALEELITEPPLPSFVYGIVPVDCHEASNARLAKMPRHA